jgi:hypothetical protein
MNVVKQRGIGRETFLAHQLLGIKGPVRTTESDMALSRNLPSNPVVRHIVSLTLSPRGLSEADRPPAIRAPVFLREDAQRLGGGVARVCLPFRL